MLNGNFVLIKIDIGNFDKNLDVAQFYSNPITKDILAAVVFGVDNNILYSTKAGKLANVRRMGENGIYDFVIKVMTAPQ